MVSARMRGAVISTSVYQGFPTTFTLGRGHTVLRLFVKTKMLYWGWWARK